MDKRTKQPGWSRLVLITLGLMICSAIPAHAQELPTSHPSCLTCKGTLSPQGRWCDNNNGTVTDMSNGLIWLKDAGWGGRLSMTTTTGGTPAADQARPSLRKGNQRPSGGRRMAM
ncbi:MAG: hypothetical protein HQK58_15575 [Deltaproteobacteria bacterium]|nr:hypothetical protein [Deltaproteobacteria bacterium]MBF0527211.1 hypothetical protein [Deltaproteobacteria bacterium]